MADASISPAPDPDEIRIGISACLLGDEVRYDGGHKRDEFLVGTLSRHVRFVRLCPEVEIGLGTPREPIRLERAAAGLRLVATRSGTDHTATMRRWARAKVRTLAKLDLSGYVLKRASPSCGMERVKVHDGKGASRRDGVGLFARALMDGMPLLPVEEEGRLHDARLRENFIERVFAYRRVTRFFSGRWTRGGLVRFHEAEKYLLLSHDPKRARELGRLVAGSKGGKRAAIATTYSAEYMRAMAVHATPRRHVNVLQHMLGFFRDALDAPARHAIAATIDEYANGLVPLVVPVTLVRHYVERLDVAYLRGQRYLEPHPRELMLRNHV